MRTLLLTAVATVALAGCRTPDPRPATSTATPMDRIAEAYVKLVLAVGEHDEGYVDAYYGPEAWKAEVTAAPPPLEALERRARELRAQVRGVDVAGEPEIVRLRREFLDRQLGAVVARLEMLRGRRFTFDEESRALYDATAPTLPEREFRAVLDSLDALLPGPGPLVERVEAFKRDFVIPPERLDTVFRAAIAEARRRTARHLALPEGEDFVLEYVTDKPWSGYNWYQGGARSLIQINTDLPIYIDRAIDLAAHEGYPGHHVYNALLEQRLVRDRGWVEFSVYPLFSPMSLIAEGSANYGIEVAFPGAERAAFERDVLYPLAGIDPARVDEYARVQALLARLSYAGNEAARRYLNGEIDREAAARWLAEYALMPLERARQRVRFFDTYRSYVINYNLGQDLVREWVERRGGTADRPERRWEAFAELLSTPRLPSGLRD